MKYYASEIKNLNTTDPVIGAIKSNALSVENSARTNMLNITEIEGMNQQTVSCQENANEINNQLLQTFYESCPSN